MMKLNIFNIQQYFGPETKCLSTKSTLISLQRLHLKREINSKEYLKSKVYVSLSFSRL